MLNKKKIENILKKHEWEYWLQRPYHAFMLSLWNESMTREYFKKIGVDTEYTAAVFQDSAWYKSTDVTSHFMEGVKKYIKNGGSIFKLTKSCELFWEKSKKDIEAMCVEPDKNLFDKLDRFREIITVISSYAWINYAFEEIYSKQLLKEVPKYIDSDYQDFINILSTPIKKNKFVIFQEELASDRDLKLIQKKFAWIKARDGFEAGFSIKNLEIGRKKIKQTSKKKIVDKITIPTALKPLATKVKELVYFRNLKIESRMELIYMMRPVLKEVAKYYKVPFNELRYYSIYDLVSKNPKRYKDDQNFIFYKGNMMGRKGKFIKTKKKNLKVIKGTVANRGVSRGQVKIVTKVADLSKIKVGDILVSQMTFPAFILAMHRASAFITDEGGITSHAAIIAREMDKPCIIGTKIATKILKDGDMVEVDANKGVIKIIN